MAWNRDTAPQAREGKIGDVGGEVFDAWVLAQLRVHAADELLVLEMVHALAEYAGGDQADGFVCGGYAEQLGDQA
jgi:hypothetical protein